MRNIVLITFDSLRADHCSFMGYGRKTTPNLDDMARDGLYFENAVAHNIPTASSIYGAFTGDQPSCKSNNMEQRIWRDEIRGNNTLAEELVDLGYETVAFQPNPWLSSYYGFNKGFSTYREFIKRDEVEMLSHGSSFISSIKKFLLGEMFFFSWENMYEQISNWASKSKKQPYFLWILSLDTHHPYTVPRKEKKWSKNNLYINYLHWKLGKEDFKPKEKKALIDAYDDGVRYADKLLGRLKEDLKDDNPVFIIHSDHGEEFWDHGHFGHGNPKYNNPLTLYEELIHIPLVIYNLGVKGKVEKPFLLSDLKSIILEIAKNGRLNQQELGDDFVLSRILTTQEKTSLRSKKWKFIQGEEGKELYNLERDPKETNNIVSENKDLIKELEKLKDNYIKKDLEKKRIKQKTNLKKSI